MTVVEERAFYKCNLTRLALPDKLRSIGNVSFYNNELISVRIPQSVISVGTKAFKANKLDEIAIGGNVSLGGDAFGNGFEAIYAQQSKKAGLYIAKDGNWAYKQVVSK
ncbi:hypothetical protein GCM10028817_22100 [Spirosoma pomorum]